MTIGPDKFSFVNLDISRRSKNNIARIRISYFEILIYFKVTQYYISCQHLLDFNTIFMNK